jgi:hypothetical protein
MWVTATTKSRKGELLTSFSSEGGAWPAEVLILAAAGAR